MDAIIGIMDIIKNNCNNDKINEISDIKLRNKEKGITALDALFYRFLYADKDKSKQEIVSGINNVNNTNFKRQSFDGKESNIPIETYKTILNEIIIHYNKITSPSNNDIDLIKIDNESIDNESSDTESSDTESSDTESSDNESSDTELNNDEKIDDKFVAVDGVYNNNKNRDILLNLGLFDITDNVPVDIKYFGVGNRNNEVALFIEYIRLNIDKFRNTIFIADRLYFNYALLEFLNDNDLKYIIRARGLGDNLNPDIPLKKKTKKYDLIKKIRKRVRLVKCKETYDQVVFSYKNKRQIGKTVLKFKPDCVIVTNLKDKKKYSDDFILKKYKSRWDIEVFFKFMKSSFKFQYMDEKNDIQYQKLYLCEMILTYIVRFVEHYSQNGRKMNNIIIKKNGDKVECTEKTNRSNLVKGIFASLLSNIIYNKLNKNMLDIFCKTYVIWIKNAKGRSFPRFSKTPYTKWNLAGYGEMTKFSLIIDAIKNKTIDDLKPNLKKIAKHVLCIVIELG